MALSAAREVVCRTWWEGVLIGVLSGCWPCEHVAYRPVYSCRKNVVICSKLVRSFSPFPIVKDIPRLMWRPIPFRCTRSSDFSFLRRCRRQQRSMYGIHASCLVKIAVYTRTIRTLYYIHSKFITNLYFPILLTGRKSRSTTISRPTTSHLEVACFVYEKPRAQLHMCVPI